jgi:hypothetical protein
MPARSTAACEMQDCRLADLVVGLHKIAANHLPGGRYGNAASSGSIGGPVARRLARQWPL